MTRSNTEIIRGYLAALEEGATGEALSRFFAADAVQTEYPNLLNPQGQESDVPRMLERAQIGLTMLREQRYTLRHIVAEGDTVAIEVDWAGTLGVSLGKLAEGTILKGRMAIFFEMADGRISRQRNYDCFEPFQL